MNKISLYVHIPFCAKKCLFCSFAVAVNQEAHISQYLSALDREASLFQGSVLRTIYIGGGTPSLLSIKAIVELGRILRARFDLSHVQEMTFECNPESVTPQKARLLKQIGVTRISLGVQSLNDAWLTYLGRPHDRTLALRAFEILRREGFENINVDLMYGFRGQSIENLADDIQALTALESEHVSVYALTVEERSLFHVRHEDAREATDPSRYEQVRLGLEASGLHQYEISNFSRTGRESVHNIHYWEGGDYIGLGMAAHAHIDGRRSWNADTLSQYLQMIAQDGRAIVGQETLSATDKMIEALLFGLRMNRGVDLHSLAQRFGVKLAEDKYEVIESFMEMGLLSEKGDWLCATDRGRLVLDEISARLV